MGQISDPGSPALLMKAARFRLGASENPHGNQGRQLCWRPGIIESAGEPGSGSAFDRLEGSARGSCSQHVDETVYLSVLFPGTRSFEGRRFRSVSCSQRGDEMSPIAKSEPVFHLLECAVKQRLLPWSLPKRMGKTVLFVVLFQR